MYLNKPTHTCSIHGDGGVGGGGGGGGLFLTEILSRNRM